MYIDGIASDGLTTNLNNFNLLSLPQNTGRDGSSVADSKVLLFRYDKDLPSLSSLTIRYGGKKFETEVQQRVGLTATAGVLGLYQFEITCSNKRILYIRHIDLRLTEIRHTMVNDNSNWKTADFFPFNYYGYQDWEPFIYTWNPAAGTHQLKYLAIVQNVADNDIYSTLTVSDLGFERQYNMANKLDVADKGRLAYTTYDRTKGTAGHNVPNKHWLYGAITELTSRIPGNVSLVRYRDGSLNNESLKNLWSFDGDVYKVNADGTITRLKSRPQSGTTHPWLLSDKGFFFIVYERKYVSPIMIYGSWDTKGNAGCKKNTPDGKWDWFYTGNNMDINYWFPTDWKSTTSVAGDPYIFQDYNGSGYHCLSAGRYYLRIPFCSTCPDTYVELNQGYDFDNETR